MQHTAKNTWANEKFRVIFFISAIVPLHNKNEISNSRAKSGLKRFQRKRK
jgi:hypothetical protein